MTSVFDKQPKKEEKKESDEKTGKGAYIACYATGCGFNACSDDRCCRYHRDVPACKLTAITRIINTERFGALIDKIVSIRRYCSTAGVIDKKNEEIAFSQLQAMAKAAGISSSVYEYQDKGALHERILGCRNRWSDEREDISVYMTRIDNEIIRIMRKVAGVDTDGPKFDPVSYLREHLAQNFAR